MVAFGVDIKGLIFRFSVWPIFSRVKVEGDVKEVGLDKAVFGSDLEVVLLKYFDDFLCYFVYVWPTCVPYHGQAIIAVQAEICELVGLYLLHNLCNLSLNAELGLYRDDGLAVVRNASGPNVDKIKKKVIKIFQQHHLKITTEANLIQTDFLDVPLIAERQAGKL